MADFDAVIVGSGVNSLACAALLARAEWRVCVLERNDWFGGAIKTEELGLDLPDERRAEVLAKVKALGARKRGLVTDDEFRELARG